MQRQFAMKKLLLLLVLCTGFFFSKGQNFRIDTVFFDFDKVNIRPEFQNQLDSLIEEFTGFPAYYVEIFGHTDNVGSEQYNLDLSEERARRIADYLTERGVSNQRVTFEGLGTSKPAAPNDSYFGRKLNRRADISVVFAQDVALPSDTVVEQVAVEEPEPEPESLVDTIYSDYTPFLINPAKQNVVIAPQGTQLTIPANAFITDASEVTLTLKELYKRKDVILSNMPTIDKEGPLESAGMFSLDARAGRKTLQIRPEAAVNVRVPATRKDDNFAAYSGSGGSRSARRKKGKKKQNPGFNAVKNWNYEGDLPVNYSEQEKAFSFPIQKSGRYALARPLYYSQDMSADDPGIDFLIKFKGRRYPRGTTAMVIGEATRTFIPLKRESTRIYTANRIKYIDQAVTPLVLVAIQYDDDGNPWLIRKSFKANDFIKRKGARPLVKMKVKFRKYSEDELEDLLEELNS